MSLARTTHRILIPLDGSSLGEQAVPFAAAIAGADDEIVFLHVAGEIEPVRDLLGRVAVEENDVEDVEISRSLDALRATADRWREVLASTPRFEVVVGDPATEILAAVDRLDCTMIVAASHGRGAVGRLAFGSVADKLTRNSTVPVMIVRPRHADHEIQKPSIFRIVVPYDGSDLAAEAFPVAADIASRLGVGLHLIHAINPSVLMPIATPMEPAYPAEVYDELLTQAENEARAAVDGATAQLSIYGLTVTSKVVNGTPFDAITEGVEANDLIVMSSHGRTGIKRWLLGSIAEKLVREGSVPVVLVPASGRESSVEES